MITCDAAIGSRDLVGPLQALGIPAQLGHISGDVSFRGRGVQGQPVSVGCELKRLPELVQALRSGRLVGEQLPKMRATYDHSWLLIEGEVMTDKAGRLLRWAGPGRRVVMPGRMTLNELYKRIWVLYLNGGLMPWFTKDRAQTLQAILALYRLWTDEDLDQHRSHLAIYHPPPPVKVSQFRQTISTLPHIGWERSLAVEAHFQGSLTRAFSASAEEWETIEGIGPKGAQAITRVLGY